MIPDPTCPLNHKKNLYSMTGGDCGMIPAASTTNYSPSLRNPASLSYPLRRGR